MCAFSEKHTFTMADDEVRYVFTENYLKKYKINSPDNFSNISRFSLST